MQLTKSRNCDRLILIFCVSIGLLLVKTVMVELNVKQLMQFFDRCGRNAVLAILSLFLLTMILAKLVYSDSCVIETSLSWLK